MCFFLFTHTSTTAIYTLSLHDALPISSLLKWIRSSLFKEKIKRKWVEFLQLWFFSTVTITVFICVIYFIDRKSTRLNSSHVAISYAVFCLKKKTTKHLIVQLRSLTSQL